MELSRRSYSVIRFSIIGAMIVLLMMTIHPFLTAWLGSLTGQYALTKTWKELVLVVLLMVALFAVARQKQVVSVLVRDRLNQLIVAYTFLHLILVTVFFNPNESEALVAGLLFNLRFLGMFILVRFVHLLLPDDRKTIIEKVINIFIVASVVIALFGILQVTVLPHDFLRHFGYDGVLTINPYSTVDDNLDHLRAFSTQRGPNTLGAFLLLPLALLLINIFKKKHLYLSLAGAAVTVLAIGLTYSRSALLAMLAVMATVVIVMERDKIKKFFPWLLAGGVVIAALAAVLVLSVPAVRLYIFHSSPGDPSLIEGSTNDHAQATLTNTGDALAHPLGQGPGSAGPASFYRVEQPPEIAENYFVQITQEVGLLGLVLFIALSLLVAKRLIALLKDKVTSSLALALLASFVGINLINMLLHGWADDPTSIVWWGFAGLVIGYHHYASASRKKPVS